MGLGRAGRRLGGGRRMRGEPAAPRIGVVSALHEELAAVLALVPDRRAQTVAGREFRVGHWHGQELVTVLSRIGSGAASPEVVDAVLAALNAEDVRPLTDQVFVNSAEIIPFAVDATLTLYPGPDSAVVLADAIARLQAYVADNHRLGRDITRAGLVAALCTVGVQNVALASPAADIEITPQQASWCTGHAVVIGGYDE